MKINNLVCLLLVSTSFLTVSCNKKFLDQVPSDRITIEQVFERRRYSEEYLANI